MANNNGKKTHCKYGHEFNEENTRVYNNKRYCKECGRNQGRNNISWTLQYYYGITKEQYDQQLEAQGGGCAICGTPPGNRRLAVDHCHSSGLVRGILCAGCNTGLGVFKDTIASLETAINYLSTNGVWSSGSVSLPANSKRRENQNATD